MIILSIVLQTPLNQALRLEYPNIIEMLLKRGAKLDLPEKIENGQEIFPMDLAKGNPNLKNTIIRMTRKVSA